MTRSRWLVLGSHIPTDGHLGGMVRYTVEMIKALESRADIEVHVHCRPESTPMLIGDIGLDPERVHATARGGTIADAGRQLFGFKPHLEAVRPSVVFGSKHMVPLLPTGNGVCRLLTVHDLLPFDRPGDFGTAKRWLLPPAYHLSLRRADVLACVSEATRGRLLEHLPEVADRTTVVANAMTPSLASVRAQRLDGLDGENFVMVVGDRSRRKNVGFVVDLWSEVVRRRPDARLLLVGPPGWGTNEALPEIAELVASGSVVEAGHIPDRQLRWAYENATATLCPSRLEGFGLPVIEALGLGCPVIHSTDPAQVEAAAGAGTAVALDDRQGWIEAIVQHLDGVERPDTAPVMARSWDDAAEELVALTVRPQGRATPVAHG